MNKEVSIKVVLSIGKKEIELTVEEARQLKDSLDQIFGKEVIEETITPLALTCLLYPQSRFIR